MKHTHHIPLRLPASPLKHAGAALAVMALLQSPAPATAWDLGATDGGSMAIPPTADGLRAVLLQENPDSKLSLSALFASKDDLNQFYASRGYMPLWVKGDSLSREASEALAVVARADDDGLVATRYGLETVKKAADAMQAAPSTQSRALLELLVSDTLFHYAADVGFGATPRQNRMRLSNLEHKPQLGPIMSMLAQSKNPAATLAEFAPDSTQYRALKSALATYRQLARQGGWPAFTPANRTIRAGERHPNIPAVRALLARMGDYPTTAAATSSNQEFADTLYDEALQAAVAQFQARHGLEPDGTLGPATQKTLTLPVQTRIEQIIASLERLRWLPEQLGERYIVVNVPSYTLGAYESGKETLTMRVIVGSRENATPIFSNQITDVTFNPSWGVPRRIAVKELLPKIRKDPSYLSRAGYRLTSGEDAVDPGEIDWVNVTAASFDYNLRQKPGSGNALGKIKFGLPNNDDIYMHDTAKPKLFAEFDRAMSHGCVRLEKPRDLALFVMRGNEGWSDERVERTYSSAESRTFRVEPVPVHLTYQTAQVDESTGRMYFFDDVYGLDRRLIAAFGQPGKTLQLAQK